jgi:hypothetical protein
MSRQEITKKKMKSFVLTTILILSFGIVYGQNAEALKGTWKGTYFCTQGETGLTLKIKVNSKGEIKGTFKFYPVPSNKDTGVKSGKFSFTGKYTSSGKIILKQSKWIKQPEGWGMIDLVGELLNPTTFSGRSPTYGCGDFKVIRQ